MSNNNNGNSNNQQGTATPTPTPTAGVPHPPMIFTITFTILDPASFFTQQQPQPQPQPSSTPATPTESDATQQQQPSTASPQQQQQQPSSFQLPLPLLLAIQNMVMNAMVGGSGGNGGSGGSIPQQQQQQASPHGGSNGGGSGGGGWVSLADFLNHTFQLHQQQRAGPPPASASAVNTLQEVDIVDESHALHGKLCAVCQDTFNVGEKAVQLPCDHFYHGDCVRPWLKEHNTCPTCRYELPTDDDEYEKGRKERMGLRDEAKRLRECQCELGRIRKTDCYLLGGDPTMVTLSCGHKLHRECAVEWDRAQRNGKCPVCNQKVAFPSTDVEEASTSMTCGEDGIGEEAQAPTTKRRRTDDDTKEKEEEEGSDMKLENPAEALDANDARPTSIGDEISSEREQTAL